MIREIPGYEGRYAACDDGEIWSFISQKFMRPARDKWGYLNISLVGADGRRRMCLVSRLVAMTFLGPPSGGRMQVNHIDGVRDNNRVKNLEWVTREENYRHSVEVLGRPPLRHVGKPVIRISPGGEVKRYRSGMDAVREGFVSSGISMACSGKSATYRGFKWQFV